MTTADLLAQLPDDCRPVVKPRHKVALEHYLREDGTLSDVPRFSHFRHG